MFIQAINFVEAPVACIQYQVVSCFCTRLDVLDAGHIEYRFKIGTKHSIPKTTCSLGKHDFTMTTHRLPSFLYTPTLMIFHVSASGRRVSWNPCRHRFGSVHPLRYTYDVILYIIRMSLCAAEPMANVLGATTLAW